MKHLFILICFVLAGAIQAQTTDTLDLTNRTHYNFIHTDDKAWKFSLPLDTLEDGDVRVILLPGTYGTAFVGTIQLEGDTITGGGTATMTAQMMERIDDEASWENTGTALTAAGVANDHDFFDVNMLKLKLTITASSGDGAYRAWVVIKPSSIQ